MHCLYYLSIPTMPPKSIAWNYFFTDKSKYKGNNYNVKAWCDHCVNAWIENQLESDQHEVDDPTHSREVVRSKADLRKQGEHQL